MPSGGQRRQKRRGGAFSIMSLQSPQQSRIEWLIAIARVVMAITALLAIWLDPSQPASYAQLAYASLLCYLLYTLGMALLAWQAVVSLRRLKLVTHSLDLTFFSLLIYITVRFDGGWIVCGHLLPLAASGERPANTWSARQRPCPSPGSCASRNLNRWFYL